MEEIRASKEYLCSYGTAVHCEVFRQYKKWHHRAARDNAPSAALAKSLGFTLEGAGLFVV